MAEEGRSLHPGQEFLQAHVPGHANDPSLRLPQTIQFPAGPLLM
jgi:hypothetical protein